MPPPLGLVYLSVDDLVAAAGGDPWTLNDEVQSGDPAQINAQADAFHVAAGSATDVESDFKNAKRRFEQGWTSNGSEHPINASDEVTRATEQLHLQKPQLAKIALDLENVAIALAAAKRTSDADIAALDRQLHQIDDAMRHASENNQDTDTIRDEAVTAVRKTLADVQEARKGYVAAMTTAKPSLDAATGPQLIGPGGDAPAMIGPFAVPPEVAAAAAARGYHPTVNIAAGGTLADLLGVEAGDTGPHQSQPGKPQFDPNSSTGKDAISSLRRILTDSGKSPAEVDAIVSAAAAAAQKPLPAYAPPTREPGPKPGMADGFRDAWWGTEDAIHRLTGQEGGDAFRQTWTEMGKGLLNTAQHPIDTVADSIKRAIDNPAYYAGQKVFDLSAAAATAPFGGEGAAIRAGLPAELLTEGGAPASVLRGWHPTGGMSGGEFESQFGTPSSRVWPSNDGFPGGYSPQPAHLPEGTIIDRFGSAYGRYLAPDGTPFADRALTPESAGSDYNRYMVTGKALPPGWQIVEGPVEPWFGQNPSPGATQYMIQGPDGVKVSVRELIDRGILDEYGPPIGR